MRPLIGRTFREDEGRPGGAQVVMLSEGLWHSQFGGRTNIVGETIMLDSKPRTVVGIIPDGSEFPALAKLWVPLAIDVDLSQRAIPSWRSVARLKEGTTVAEASSELGIISKRLEEANPESNRGRTFNVLSLKDASLGPTRNLMPPLFFAIGFMMLIVCANVANLLLSHSSSRMREFSLRASLGAGRFTLVRQLLTECSILAFIGCFLGVYISWFCIDLLSINRPDTAPPWFNFKLDSRVLLFGAAISAFAVFLFGIVALGLAGIGTYGVMAHATSQRTQEIGIRMSLGARSTDMLKMVIAQGIRIVSVGLGIGLVGAFVVFLGGKQFMSEMTGGEQSLDISSLAIACTVLGFITLLACYIPARRASRIEPMSALRYE